MKNHQAMDTQGNVVEKTDTQRIEDVGLCWIMLDYVGLCWIMLDYMDNDHNLYVDYYLKIITFLNFCDLDYVGLSVWNVFVIWYGVSLSASHSQPTGINWDLWSLVKMLGSIESKKW